MKRPRQKSEGVCAHSSWFVVLFLVSVCLVSWFFRFDSRSFFPFVSHTLTFDNEEGERTISDSWFWRISLSNYVSPRLPKKIILVTDLIQSSHASSSILVIFILEGKGCRNGSLGRWSHAEIDIGYLQVSVLPLFDRHDVRLWIQYRDSFCSSRRQVDPMDSLCERSLHPAHHPRKPVLLHSNRHFDPKFGSVEFPSGRMEILFSLWIKQSSQILTL